MGSPNTTSKKEKKYPLPFLLPLIAVLAFIPLIVHLYEYDTGLTQYDWFQGPSQTKDFFLHAKMIWLLITFAVTLFIMAYMIFSAEIKPLWDKSLLPIIIYGVLSFLSACTSINSRYSFTGIYEQFEPVWILMGYCLILYYAFYILNTEQAIKRLMRFFVAGIVLACIVGLFQAFKHDLLGYRFIQQFVVPKNIIGKVTFNFEAGRTYLALYNPNYVGFYVAMIVPVLVALLFHAQKILFKIGYGVLAIVMLWILFASQSRSGIIALAVSMVVMMLCMRKVIFKNWFVALLAIVLVIGAFIGVNIMNQGVLIDRMKTMFTTEPETHALESIVTKEDVAITYNGHTFHISATQDENSNDVFKVIDENGQNISYTKATADNPDNVVTDQRFPFTFASVRADNFTGFLVKINDTSGEKTWYFSNLMKEGDSEYYVKGLGNAFFQLKTHKKGVKFLEEHYHFANKRGYIWARTLPLLKKYFFLGSGPDTFTMAFPNDDLVGLYNSGHDNEIISRPHCMYLQIGVQTGVPSLIAFLVFFGWYILSSLRLYWKADYSSYLPKIGVAALGSVISYLILGITNDSCVAVAPIFFVLAGLGLGINYRLKKSAK